MELTHWWLLPTLVIEINTSRDLQYCIYDVAAENNTVCRFPFFFFLGVVLPHAKRAENNSSVCHQCVSCPYQLAS